MTKEEALEKTRLYFEALKSLPEEFVDGETQTCVWYHGDLPAVFAVNPKFQPYYYQHGQWKPVRLT